MACTGASKLWVLVILLVTAVAHIASAAAFQPTLDKAGNAVGSTVSGRHWHDQKLASRIQGWQNCLQKYMSKDHRQEDAGQPADPCFLDTGAGAALTNTAESHESGRALLQASSSIPNYAASGSAATTGSGSPVAGSNNEGGAASTTPTAGLGPATHSQSSANTSTTSGNQLQSAFAAASTPPVAAGSTSSVTTRNGGGVMRDKPVQAAVAEPAKPQPIGPDPTKWQQTQDFPEGTRLTHDEASLLLSGLGFHPKG